MNLKWRFGIIAGLFLAMFSLYPQIKMMYIRGGEWNGNYAYNDIDEMAYSAYLRALIDGRPRKNDPYTGIDHSAESPQPESLFSIQFAAPYSIAIPARLLGIETPWAMTISGAIASFLAGLAVFWLIGIMTNDSCYAMAAALGVFCFGTLASGEGALLHILTNDAAYPFFPAFRRYIPALAIPAFFIFAGSVWKLMESGDLKIHLLIIAIISYVFMVFSYFYLWTAALAWLVLFLALKIGTDIRTESIGTSVRKSAFLASGVLLAMLPYWWLLSQRAKVTDEVQLLAFSHSPDLNRMPIFIGLFVVAVMAILILKKNTYFSSNISLFIISMALMPLAAFNQQIVTGYSLQPIHYAVFIGNYSAVLSLMLVVGIILFSAKRKENPLLRKLSLAILFLSALVWGTVEAHYTTAASDHMNMLRDMAYPVSKRIEQLAGANKITVLSYDMVLANEIPSASGQSVLWGHHQQVFTGLDSKEQRERFFYFMYYSGATPDNLELSLRNSFVTSAALFGWGRHTDRLTVDSKPLTESEISNVVAEYDSFIGEFNYEKAAKVELFLVVVMNDRQNYLDNLEKWYELDDGQPIGNHTLYRVRLRNNINDR